jgi:hypothetical protein
MTFGLNFWKGERGVRRANLERLYTAVHRTIGGVGALKAALPNGIGRNSKEHPTGQPSNHDGQH